MLNLFLDTNNSEFGEVKPTPVLKTNFQGKPKFEYFPFLNRQILFIIKHKI